MHQIDRRSLIRLLAAGAGASVGGEGLLHQANQSIADNSIKPTGVSEHARPLIARMAVQPTSARCVLIESLISALVDAEVWNKLDGLYVFAAHDVQSARLNWVGCMKDLTSVNAPTFEIDRGFSGDGATSYLDTDTPMSALERLKPDDGTVGVYALRREGGSARAEIALIGRYLKMDWHHRKADHRADGDAGRNSVAMQEHGRAGLFALSRDASNAHVYHCGRNIQSVAARATVASVLPLTILQVGGTYSTSQVFAAFFGAGLSSIEHAAINVALSAYLRAAKG